MVAGAQRPGLMLLSARRLQTSPYIRKLNFSPQVVAKVYTEYCAALQASNLLDFDDLLGFCLDLMEQHPAVARRISAQYRYVLVDEFQARPRDVVRHTAAAVGTTDDMLSRLRIPMPFSTPSPSTCAQRTAASW